jgi:hypothetical protein
MPPVSRVRAEILFITGFAENAAISNGHLESGMEVMTKPFITSALIGKVRGILNHPADFLNAGQRPPVPCPPDASRYGRE